MLDHGILTKEPTGYQVKFERHLAFNAQTVWDAITQPQKLAIWFTDFEMDFREGGSLLIRFRDEAKTESHGKIVRIDPPQIFQWTWEDELATWEIIPQGEKECTLRLTYSKLPSSYAISVPPGWHILLNKLDAVLKGDTTPYPFGTESEETKQMRSYYIDLYKDRFPELVKTPFTIERTYHASATNVWRALTEKEQMKQWYFDLAEFKPEVGFEFSFYGQGHKGAQYLHRCKITEVIEEKKLTYSWSYEGYEGMSYVTFELFEEGKQTRVKLTHAGLETFPHDNPDFAPTSFAQGWTELIGTLLRKFIEG